MIVGVFTAIAVARSPRHHLRHGSAFPGEQKPVLIFEALQPARCDVVLGLCRGLVRLWFSRKPFSHRVSCYGEHRRISDNVHGVAAIEHTSSSSQRWPFRRKSKRISSRLSMFMNLAVTVFRSGPWSALVTERSLLA